MTNSLSCSFCAMIEGSGSVPWLKSLLQILNSDGSESILVGWIWRRAKMTHKILKFFGADPGSGMEKVGSGINIPDPQHWIKILDPDSIDSNSYRYVTFSMGNQVWLRNL